MRAKLKRVRRAAGGRAVEGLFHGLSAASKLSPQARRALRAADVVRDVSYGPHGEANLLDVYRSVGSAEGSPALLYIHGGGFRILSKDTHWLMGLAFARRGYTVFSINYRLAPKHPYPAAAEDACLAAQWVADNAHHYGADASRLVISGESAGANLALAVTLANTIDRPEPWAAALRGKLNISALIAACGMLQVSDCERYQRRRPDISTFVSDRIVEVASAYLGPEKKRDYGLADPLLVLEGLEQCEGLPPTLAFAGTKDPILHDTRRLAAALARLDVPHEMHIYKGGMHAFHAFTWQARARQCWRDQYRFLDRIHDHPA